MIVIIPSVGLLLVIASWALPKMLNNISDNFKNFFKTKNVVLDIYDNGGGIPKAILPKIFDPYFTSKAQGTGMGLYMSRMIVENHMKGRITVESENKGTCFSLSLPQ